MLDEKSKKEEQENFICNGEDYKWKWSLIETHWTSNSMRVKWVNYHSNIDEQLNFVQAEMDGVGAGRPAKRDLQ